MAKIKYTAKENKKVGTHSYYGAPVFNGKLTTEELLEEALDGKSVEPSIARAVIEEYMKAIKRNVLKGFRCELGTDFLTVYPNISVSVKDTKDEKTGETIVATAKMLTAANAKSRIGCSVAAKFSQKFAAEVSWQKVDQSGAVIDEEDITQGNENVEGGTDNTPTNTGGGNDQGGGDDVIDGAHEG